MSPVRAILVSTVALLLISSLANPVIAQDIRPTTEECPEGTIQDKEGDCGSGEPTLVVVGPDGAVSDVRAEFTSDHVESFWLENRTAEATTYRLTCSAPANVTVTRCGTGGTGTVWLAPHISTILDVVYDVSAAGFGRLTLTAEAIEYEAADSGYVQVVVEKVPAVPTVTPEGASEVFVETPNSQQTQNFNVVNNSTSTFSFTTSASCDGTASACSVSPGSVTLAGRASAPVAVSYQAGDPRTSGTVTLTATQSDNGAYQASATVNVAVGGTGAPAVSVDDANSGDVVARGLCLTIAAGAGAAYECGDLRIVHALPTTRTQNKPRTPMLLYNHGLAQPYPLVAADASLASDVFAPDSVVATLHVDGVEVARGAWDGSAWEPGATRRITLGFDAGNHATGLYGYTLEVANWYGSERRPATATGELIVVNRGASPFGAGWWLAGLEQLFFLGSDLLWVGGDGSARVYRRFAANGWAARSLDHPDTLRLLNGSYYQRRTPAGVKVRFDLAGRHYKTINRLGHHTNFDYDAASGRLEAIRIPPGFAGLSYDFVYDGGGVLGSVVSPPVGGRGRITVIDTDAGRVTGIRDPDGSSVDFGYPWPALPGRIGSRTDRRDVTTFFDFGPGRKLTESKLPMPAPAEEIVMGFRPQESLAFPGTPALPEGRLYTRLDGPRTDVADTTVFQLDRFGAPIRTVDALGHETRLFREDERWPALVTKAVFANGQIVSATYDERGNMISSTDSSTFQDGRYATTRYEWDPRWASVTKIVPPEGDSTVIAYDPANGNRLWQQDARGTSSRVEFRYNGRGLLRVIDPPLSGNTVMSYGPLGNLSTVTTPKGYTTTYHQDAVGRDTLVVSPIDTLGQSHVRSRTAYDLMDRDTLTESSGPQLRYIFGNDAPLGSRDYTTPAERLVLRKSFDPEGNLLSVSRSADPDLNSIGPITTRWRYDNAGRPVAEVAPDGAVDSTVYDAAGNVTGSYTRRGWRITMWYDPLSRLIRRLTPGVEYAGENTLVGGEFDTEGDFATFTYDPVGNLLTANNDYAHISRTYNKNGTLATDSLKLRSWSGFPFIGNAYGISYEYDLNGRRVTMIHPENVAPRVNGVLKDAVKYTYDGAGRLQSVTDVLGNSFEYDYDEEGRLEQLTYPGAIFELFDYDDDGRLKRRQEIAQNEFVGTAVGFDQSTLHDESYLYDARGKIVSAFAHNEDVYNGYTGLGTLARTGKQPILGPQDFRTEIYVPDALGNTFQSWWQDLSSGPVGDSTLVLRNYIYDRGTGRLRRYGHPNSGSLPRDAVADEALNGYDGAGNRDSLRAQRFVGGETILELVDHFYGADEQLRGINRLACIVTSTTHDGTPICDLKNDPPYSMRSVSEDYRYDALGRRVVHRSVTPDSLCKNHCDDFIERTVWDGDQVLYEIRYPGYDNVFDPVDWHLERDTGLVVDPGHPFGRVAYTHGAGIDRPLSIVRMNYSTDWPEPIAVIPHSNWRGLFDLGSFPDGRKKQCRDLGDPQTCVTIEWPAPHKGIYFLNPIGEKAPPQSWFGHLITQKRDGSGLLYMRNRYYDPAEGRFTQEDPIGLAGGLNLYGFAAGDPVNLSDPFGLCPCIVPIAIGIFEIGSAIYDIYQAVKTHRDPNATAEERSESIYAAGAGAFLPGPGSAYRAAGKALSSGRGVANAGGVIRSFVTEEPEVYYRVFSERKVGGFLTKTKPKSSAWAREALGLPPGNEATYVQEVLVPAGTRLQRSRALSAFGRRGGAEQFELLDQIPSQNFGPGVPFR